MTLKHTHIPDHPKRAPRADKEPELEDVEADEVSHIDEGLQVIYGDDRSDLKTVHRDPARLTRGLSRLVLVLAILAVVAYGGFFLYSFVFDKGQSETPLSMEIEAPAEVKSGEYVKFEINYQNPTNVPIASLEVDVALPAAFSLVQSQPEPTNRDELIWTIGSLGPNSDGKITLEGVWLSAVPSDTTIQALATYKPGNFNSNFSDIATAKITTLSSVLTLEMTGPETGIPGTEAEYTAKIKNTGEELVAAPSFKLTLPEGFILNSSTPTLEAGAEAEWLLADLAPEAEATITWKGTFATDVSDVQQFEGEVTVPEDDRKLSQVVAQAFTDVAGSALQATLVVNGNTDKATTELGGTLRLTIRLENTGEEDLSDASATLDFKPDSGIPILWDDAALGGGDLTSAGIVFDSELIGILKPGDRKIYNLSFPIKDELAANEVDEWTGTVFLNQGGSSLQTPPFPISMKANADLFSEGRYYSEQGAPLGTGPLPPEVGQATTYKVFWTIGEAVHDLESVSVTATIPPDVSWNNQVLSSLGNATYDSGTQTVTWEISDLPAGQSATTEFSLKLIPGSEDVGTFVKLLSGAVLKATDIKTQSAILSEAEPLTTEIPNDTFAAGRGTVSD